MKPSEVKSRGEIKIREIIISDYDDMISLWRSLPGMGLSGADEKGEIEKFLMRNPTTCILAEFEGKIVGTVLGGFDWRRGYIYHLAVEKALWKRGIGRVLMDELERRFAKLGAQKIHLMIYVDNDAVEFYEGLGYIKRDDIEIMSKDLV